MSTYRTLREASALRDYSNSTLKFNRTRADAGMHGPLDEEYGNGAGIVLWGLVGALLLWAFFWLVLGATP